MIRVDDSHYCDLIVPWKWLTSGLELVCFSFCFMASRAVLIFSKKKKSLHCTGWIMQTLNVIKGRVLLLVFSCFVCVCVCVCAQFICEQILLCYFFCHFSNCCFIKMLVFYKTKSGTIQMCPFWMIWELRFGGWGGWCTHGSFWTDHSMNIYLNV
jgi:hypothetical protein